MESEFFPPTCDLSTWLGFLTAWQLGSERDSQNQAFQDHKADAV